MRFREWLEIDLLVQQPLCDISLEPLLIMITIAVRWIKVHEPRELLGAIQQQGQFISRMNEIGYGAQGVPTLQVDITISTVERNAEPLADCLQFARVDGVGASQFRVIIRA